MLLTGNAWAANLTQGNMTMIASSLNPLALLGELEEINPNGLGIGMGPAHDIQPFAGQIDELAGYSNHLGAAKMQAHLDAIYVPVIPALDALLFKVK